MRKTGNISLAEALLALLAEDLNDHDTTSIHAVTLYTMGRYSQTAKNVIFWWEHQHALLMLHYMYM